MIERDKRPEFRNIRVDDRGARVTIALNRPDKLNPLDWETVKELRCAVERIETTIEARTVVITGSGRSFSAGGDLEGYIKLYRDPPAFRSFLEDLYQLLQGMEASSKVYVAAVNGVCVAGGLELMLACDVVIAAEEARIGDGHLNFGQLPGAGGSQRLARAVGPLRAKHLLFSGDLVSAREAERMGMVTMVVPARDLDIAVSAYVDKLHAKSRVGVKGAKYLLNQAAKLELAAGLRLELDYVHAYATTETDATEGLMAFRDKRLPRFGPERGMPTCGS